MEWHFHVHRWTASIKQRLPVSQWKLCFLSTFPFLRLIDSKTPTLFHRYPGDGVRVRHHGRGCRVHGDQGVQPGDAPAVHVRQQHPGHHLGWQLGVGWLPWWRRLWLHQVQGVYGRTAAEEARGPDHQDTPAQ